MAFFSKKRKIKKLKSSVEQMQNELVTLSHQMGAKDVEIESLKAENEKLKYFIHSNGLENAQGRITFLEKLNKNEEEAKKRVDILNQEAEKAEVRLKDEMKQIAKLEKEIETKRTTLARTLEKTKRLKSFFSALQKAEQVYFHLSDTELEAYNLPPIPGNEIFNEILEELSPEVELKLHCMDQKKLRKEFQENDKKISELTQAYGARYTTKSNKALYQLMVLALRAELQNVLTRMKFGSLDEALKSISNLCDKYIQIVIDGNQAISKTLLRFIVEIEELFKNAVHIEYQYYIEKERVRAEQAAIREQMRQEAEERKELQRQQKQMEKEESKFRSEIEKVEEQIKQEQDDEAIRLLQEKIAQLETQLSGVEERKEEIVNRQNGKAGNVYVISNLGSFGENVFKVGMTRRLDPMDRIRELSSASVPFEFDVHAMIFSEDAVSLEKKLHTIMDEYRLNKVNLRKEFFKLPLNEIEKLVLQEDPAASFNRTMLALQYNQSISMKKESSNMA